MTMFAYKVFVNAMSILYSSTHLDTKGLKVKYIVRKLAFHNHVKAISKSALYHLLNIAKLRGLMVKHICLYLQQG